MKSYFDPNDIDAVVNFVNYIQEKEKYLERLQIKQEVASKKIYQLNNINCILEKKNNHKKAIIKEAALKGLAVEGIIVGATIAFGVITPYLGAMTHDFFQALAEVTNATTYLLGLFGVFGVVPTIQNIRNLLALNHDVLNLKENNDYEKNTTHRR